MPVTKTIFQLVKDDLAELPVPAWKEWLDDALKRFYADCEAHLQETFQKVCPNDTRMTEFLIINQLYHAGGCSQFCFDCAQNACYEALHEIDLKAEGVWQDQLWKKYMRAFLDPGSD